MQARGVTMMSTMPIAFVERSGADFTDAHAAEVDVDMDRTRVVGSIPVHTSASHSAVR